MWAAEDGGEAVEPMRKTRPFRKGHQSPDPRDFSPLDLVYDPLNISHDSPAQEKGDLEYFEGS